MKKQILYLLLISSFGIKIIAQNVNIPDANFKAELVSNTAINTNNDSEIQVSEATAFSGVIDVSNKGISDLTGIEAFTLITGLSCDVNLLTNIDVSSNVALTYLTCANNQLTSLNVSNCSVLDYLSCLYNQLTSLDVSANTELLELQCGGNLLTSINVNGCTKLDILVCNYNQLTSIDASTNTLLTTFFCNNNLLTSANLSSNGALSTFFCNNNNLIGLNLSSSSSLSTFDCNNNQLTSLNIKNGNNTNISYFDATNNPNLTCIQVDDATYMNTNWGSGKDAIATYNTDCSTGITENLNNDFINIFPNPVNDFVNIAWNTKKQFDTIDLLDITGRKIKSINIEQQISNIKIDLSTLPSGIYFIEMKSKQAKECKKLIKN